MKVNETESQNNNKINLRLLLFFSPLFSCTQAHFKKCSCRKTQHLKCDVLCQVCFHFRRSALTIVPRQSEMAGETFSKGLSFLTLSFIFPLCIGDDGGREEMWMNTLNLRLKCKNPGMKAIATEEADNASAQSPRYLATQKHGFYPCHWIGSYLPF